MRARGERGSMAVEFSIVAPMLLLVLSLVFAYGRVAMVNGTFDGAVRDAARSATQGRDDVAAGLRAREVILAAVGAKSQCGSSLTVVVDSLQPGGTLTVTASCRYSMSDLALPGMPGSVVVESSFSSPVDPNRGVAP